MTPRATIAATAAARGHHCRGVFTSLEHDLELHYSADAELDETFAATDAVNGELLMVEGWLFVLGEHA